MDDERKIEEEEKLEWEEAKKINDEEDVDIPDEYDDIKEMERLGKKGILSLAILAIALFIFGILIGRRLLLIDEPKSKMPVEYVSKTTEKEETDMYFEDEDTEEDEVTYNEDEEEEAPLVYAKYHLEDSNEFNRNCAITFGKGGNFSFCLGNNDSYIYGNYYVENGLVTCNAITYRDSEISEPVGSSFKLQILRKEEVEITEVSIYEGSEGLDKELITLDGLRSGFKYLYKK